jgi:hypothetical protein
MDGIDRNKFFIYDIARHTKKMLDEGLDGDILLPQFIRNNETIIYEYIKISDKYNHQIWSMSIDGSNKTCLTCDLNGTSSNFKISPDGIKILFHNYQQENKTMNIWIMSAIGRNKINIIKDVNSQNPRGLTSLPQSLNEEFSPDSKKVLLGYPSMMVENIMFGGINGSKSILDFQVIDTNGNNNINISNLLNNNNIYSANWIR